MNIELFDKHTELASQGNAKSCCVLGLVYLTGDGAKEDVKTAVYWFEKSSSLGFVDAKIELALLYLAGDRMPVNCEKVLDLLENATANDSFKAQYILGVINSSESMNCSKCDYKRAFDLFNLAYKNGHTLSGMSKARLMKSGKLGMLNRIIGYLFMPILALFVLKSVFTKQFDHELWGYDLTERYTKLGKFK